jgi:hypothetical protein
MTIDVLKIRSLRHRCLVGVAIAIALIVGPMLNQVRAAPASYSGRATVVDATVLGVTTVLADTGPLPPAGGELNAYQLTADVPGLLSAEALGATAVGQGFNSHSQASLATLDLTAGSNNIDATLVSASANAECTAAGPATTGLVEVLGLTINGSATTVTGEVNQIIPITGGSIIINEQTSSITANSAEITVNAIHVIIPGVADIKIAATQAGVTCQPPTGDGYTYGGRGTGLTVDVLGVTTHVADTGELPASGGTLHTTTAGASFPGVVSTGVLEASSTGQNGETESRASVATLDLGILGSAIGADVIKSVAKAKCEDGVPSVVGGSEFVNLVINGLTVNVTGQANVVLPFGDGQVIINEQITNVTSTTGEITVNALHIIVAGVADVIVAHSRAYIECPAGATTPTATAPGPTSTATATSVGPTSTATATSVGPTSTATATSVGPTSTATATSVGPTSTATATGGSCQAPAPTHQQTVAGGSTNSSTVTSPSVGAGTSDTLYLASISTKPNVAVSSVSGLGLSWTLVKAQCAGRSQTRIEVWKAQGAGTSGAVAATLASAPANAVIEVSRYSGAAGTGAVVSANTNGTNGMCTGGTDDSDYQVNMITSSCNSLVFGGASMRHRTHTPGGGYTERAEFMQGSSGNAASLAVTDKLVPTSSSVSVEGSFSGSVDWAVIGIEIVAGGGATATPGGLTSTATATPPAATSTATSTPPAATSTATATSVGPTSTATATGGSCQAPAPTHQQTVAGGSTGSSTVTSPSVGAGTSGTLYLASISTKPNVAVSSVAGLGLTWTLVKAQCAGRSQTRIEVWKAQGAGTSGAVVATFASAPANAVIEVSRYSGAAGTGAVVSANTNGNNGMCTGGTDDNDYQVNMITSSCNSLVFGGASMRNRTHTPGGGYTERAEFMQGSSGNAASLAVTDKLVPTSSSVSVEGTFSGSVDWAVIGIEIVAGGGATATPGGSTSTSTATPGGPTSTATAGGPTSTATAGGPTSTATAGGPTSTATATPGGPTSTSTATPPAIAECGNLYAVHDENGNDSQFFKVALPSEQVTAIGSSHVDHDLEGLDIQPTTRVLYTTAGSANQHGQDGFLFTVNAATGALTVKGDTTFSEVTALSFRPTDHTLWGWSEGAGIIKINIDTGVATLEFNSTLDGEGMAWNNAGTFLYVTDHRKIYRYDPVAETLTLQATNLPGETEALETRADGKLWGGLHKSGAVSIYVYDPAVNQTISSEDISTQYNDVEGIAWADSCPLP